MSHIKKNTDLELGVYNDHIKKFGYLNSIINRNKPVYCSSFPLKLVGGVGDQRKEMLYIFSDDFISKDKGLIFVEDNAYNISYIKLFSSARFHNRTDDFYILNLMSFGYSYYGSYKEEYPSHSINLINPIVDNIDAFQAITQSPFSTVLQSLCQSIASHGFFVTLEHLKSFCSLESLADMLSNPMFSASHLVIDTYLHDIEYYPNRRLSNPTHLSNIAFYTDFLRIAQDYPFLFSDEPGISIDSIYNQNKILLILLPHLGMTVTKFSIVIELLSHQLLDRAYKDCDSGVIFDNYFFYLKDNYLIDFFTSQKRPYLTENRKIIFSSPHFSSDPNQTTTQYCNSFLLLPLENYTFEKNYMARLMNKGLTSYIEVYYNRFKPYCKSALYIDFQKNSSLEQSTAKKEENFIITPINIKYKKIELAEFYFLNRTRLTQFHSLKAWRDPFFSKFS